MNEREEIGSLCSGYGGLDRALAAVLRLPVAWHAEIEKLTDAKTGKVRDNPVCQVLDARYPGLPNHGDIMAIDWTSLARPRALAAGFPCQAVSGAGLQLAEADPRWLWPAVRTGIDALRPEWVAIENVAKPGLDPAWRALARHPGRPGSPGLLGRLGRLRRVPTRGRRLSPPSPCVRTGAAVLHSDRNALDR